MSDEPKFCKDCKHFQEARSVAFSCGGFTWAESCNQPETRDLIHGHKIPADPRSMRAERGDCKPEALLWEEKPATEVIPDEAPEPPTRTQYIAQPPVCRVPEERPGSWWTLCR